MSSGKQIAFMILAAVLGEITLILLTTVAQELLFRGIDYYTSPITDIIFGGLATFLAAVLAGLVAALIVKGRSFIPHILISIIIAIETGYLIISGALGGPIWFDIGSGLALILGIWTGHYASHALFYHS